MSIFIAATVALEQWSVADAVIMVAIAGPESGYNLRAEGDPWWIYPAAVQAEAQLYACPTYTSIGLWQINMYPNRDIVAAITSSSDPCFWTNQLKFAGINALAARRIRDRQGYGAWTAFLNGSYQAFMDRALSAVNQVLGLGGQPGLIVPVEPPFAAVAPPSFPVSPSVPPVAPL